MPSDDRASRERTRRVRCWRNRPHPHDRSRPVHRVRRFAHFHSVRRARLDPTAIAWCPTLKVDILGDRMGDPILKKISVTRRIEGVRLGPSMRSASLSLNSGSFSKLLDPVSALASTCPRLGLPHLLRRLVAVKVQALLDPPSAISVNNIGVNAANHPEGASFSMV